MKILLLSLVALASIALHAQNATIVITPKSANQQALDSLNQSLRELGDSFQQRRDQRLREQQWEMNKRLEEERLKYMQLMREKEAKAQAATNSMPLSESPAVSRYQMLNCVVTEDGKASNVLLKMDTVTGRTWELTRADNGAASWREVASETKRQYTAEEYEVAAKAFDADGKTGLAELARQRAQELRASTNSTPEQTSAPK